MFIVFLNFTDKRERAPALMAEHNEWLQQGFADQVFVLAGSVAPARGGAIIAHNVTREDIESRVSEDPLVTEGIVAAEIIELTPTKVAQSLALLDAEVAA
ncbi:YciI family protein [Gilvimarinus sp. SDUM040013]|uniref:YciI family protein n=1 Tax=Gilvimarinus gilvus TaxID=3058038 RepID=A0ABU4S2G0_9GAMM|nr:YciI family protein [Gilvimarinus sp. SDUM040013]MDO3385464.1 YciI family protein [Gilvimarinus sp. SDUM040013]MDX6851119.1 YciI family protein [Gilvimarinus sp. SDUM040013]